jgi:HNH endonuclease/AP2 domain
MLTQAELKRQLHYDPETGLFTRLTSPSSNAKIGDVAGWNSCGYIRIRLNRKMYMAHRLVWLYMFGKWPENEIDHINRNKTDNRLVNLRSVTRQKNQWNPNIRKDNTSGYIGVTWHKATKKYAASISINKKNIHLGLFHTAEKAGQAYLKAKSELHVI